MAVTTEVSARGRSTTRRSLAFDRVAAPAAVIDGRGIIVETNQAWRLFGRLNDIVPGETAAGVDYLATFDRAAADGRPDAAAVATALRSVLSGERQAVEVEYALPSAQEDRWFLLQAMAAPVGDATGAVICQLNVTGRRMLAERLADVVGYDLATGLPDPGAVEPVLAEAIAQAAARGASVTLVGIDLDGIASVAEQLGPAAADEVMTQVVARVRRLVRRGDVLCRRGPYGLLVVSTDVEPDAIEPLAVRFRAAVVTPFQVGSTEISLAASVGVVSGTTDDEPAALLAASDLSVTEARSAAHVLDPVFGLAFRGPDGRSPRVVIESLSADPPERFRADLLDAVGEAVIATDPDGRILYLNRAAEAMYGWTARDAQGVNVAEVLVAEDDGQAADLAARARAGEAWSGEMVVRRVDGTSLPLQVTHTPVHDGEQLIASVAVAIDLSERKATERSLQHQAHHDPSIDVPNQRSLLDQVDRELAVHDYRQGPVAVIVIDIDDFHEVGLALGHPAGEELIGACTRALLTACRPADIVARVSGDSLAVCCPTVRDADDALAHTDELRAAIAHPVAVAGARIEVRTSAGVALSEAGEETAALLLERADTALFRAREAGRDSSWLYDDALRRRLLRQIEVEAVVRRAIERGEVPMAYQPIMRLSDQAMRGAEALLRLSDDHGDPIPATEVVRVAERTGAIGELGRLVLRQTCQDAARWVRAMPDREFVASVNISARQLGDPDLPDMVATELEAAGLQPSRLSLEISESALMDDPVRAARRLAQLKMRGVRLMVDDFGTGRSSLAHLKRFPIDGIKLDRSFIAGLPASLEDHAIVRAMIGVAQALGLDAVAEGLESEQQLVELQRLGCGYGQGFLWSRAVRADAVPVLLATRAGESAALPVADEPDPEPPDDEAEAEAAPAGAPARRGGSSSVDSAFRVLVHEIRTPLTVVMGYASLLEQVEDADDADAAARIRRASERIERLIRNLDDVGSVDSGTLRLNHREVDVVPFVERVVEDVRDALNAPITVSVVGEPVPVTFDDIRVEQTLINLVTNAAKYTPMGLTIVVEVRFGDEWLDISVIDEGAGIPSEELGLIFRKYGRAERSVPGTGLGLYLARGVARAHGGDVLYRRRQPESGSVFTLRLPGAGAQR